MSVVQVEGGRVEEAVHNIMRFAVETRTLTGNITLVKQSPTIQMLDPGGAARTVTLPALVDSKGLVFLIANKADALEVLTVKNAGAVTIVTPTQNEAAIVWSDGVTWSGMVGSTA